MSNDAHSSHIDVLLAEADELEEIERVQQARLELENDHINKLKQLKQSIKLNGSKSEVSKSSQKMLERMEREIHALEVDQAERKKLVAKIPRSHIFGHFLRLVHDISLKDSAHETAAHDAEEGIDAARWWAHVRQSNSWCDLRLPSIDIKYRIAVSLLNEAKKTAFTYYQENQQAIRVHHRKRKEALEALTIPDETTSHLARDDTLIEDPSQGVGVIISSPTMYSDAPLSGNIRGPFAPVKYINYLDEGKPAYPVFGLSLRATGHWMSGLILRQNRDPYSPPPPIFTSPYPEGTSLEEAIKVAFNMERLWEGDARLEHAFVLVTEGNGGNTVDKGWLLGFLLANLSRPLMHLSNAITKFPGRGIASESIMHVMPKDLELEVLKRIWRHTDLVNIQLGAAAITQTEGMEQLLHDIRGKWDIDQGRPLPPHLRRSQDSSRRKTSTVSRRSASGEYTSN